MSKTSYICNCDVIHEDIVNDVKSKMQPKDDYIQLASLFKLFGDGTRVQILHALEQSEMCVCDLAVLLGVTKSAISIAAIITHTKHNSKINISIFITPLYKIAIVAINLTALTLCCIIHLGLGSDTVFLFLKVSGLFCCLFAGIT